MVEFGVYWDRKKNVKGKKRKIERNKRVMQVKKTYTHKSEERKKIKERIWKKNCVSNVGK